MSKNEHSESLRILVVDDDRSIRRFLSVSLTSCGYQALTIESGAQAVEAVTSFQPDVVILDLGLPVIDGLVVIEELRKQSQVPIIILSVRDRQEDKIEALDKGADDYLTKPFGIEELHARLRAVLRRTTRTDEEPLFKSGRLSVDFARRLVIVGGKEVDLTPTEYDILKLLALRAGKVVTHRMIFQQIWNKEPGEHEGAEHLLRVTMSHLRKKLEPNPDKPEFIITEPAVGYRLKAE
ncbi:MAG: response regulator transcription factor [Candidatus Aminicenantes bacterium]|nr:response regulator transcription factor [Candidatus Aminicenantes bacterium]